MIALPYFRYFIFPIPYIAQILACNTKNEERWEEGMASSSFH